MLIATDEVAPAKKRRKNQKNPRIPPPVRFEKIAGRLTNARLKAPLSATF